MFRRAPVLALLLLPAVLTGGCESGPARGLPEATALERRAARALAEGRVAEARELFMRATTQSDEPFQAFVGVARCGIAAGDWPLVELALESAMRSSPKSPEAHDLLGRTLLLAARQRGGEAGKVNAIMATRFFTEARRLDPSLPGLTHHVGVAQLLAGHPDRALALLEGALRENPEDEDVLASVVFALRRLGRRKALRTLLEALDEQGRLPESRRPDLVWARQGEP